MPLSNPIAYFFVYHGSRDVRSGESARRLSEHIMEVLAAESRSFTAIAHPDSAPEFSEFLDKPPEGKTSPYQVGALELAEIPLHQQIARFGQQAKRKGISHLCVVPLFLLPGVHVREDIPEEVSLAQRTLGQYIRLELCPYMGSHAEIAEYLEAHCARYGRPSSKTARILVNHGSKRPRANEPVEAIAHRLNATIAYWSMPPSLETCLDELIGAGFRDIIIIPYFLFAGKTSDAIAQTVRDYCHRFPQIRIHLELPMGEGAAIAPLFADVVQSHRSTLGLLNSGPNATMALSDILPV